MSTYVYKRARADDSSTVELHPLNTLARPSPPPVLHDRIVAAIRAEAVRQRRRRRLRRYAALVLSTLLKRVAMCDSDAH